MKFLIRITIVLVSLACATSVHAAEENTLPAKAPAPSKGLQAVLAPVAKCSLDKGNIYDCAKKWVDSAWVDDPKESPSWTAVERLRARAAMLGLLKDKRPAVRWLALHKLNRAKPVTSESLPQEVDALLTTAEAEKHPQVLGEMVFALAHRPFSDETAMKRLVAVSKAHPSNVFAGSFVWNCCSHAGGTHRRSAELLAYTLELAASKTTYERSNAEGALTHFAETFPDRACPALAVMTKDADDQIASRAFSNIALAKCTTHYEPILKTFAGLKLAEPLPARYESVDLTLLWMCQKHPAVAPRAAKLLQHRVKSSDATCRTLEAAFECDRTWGVSVAKAEKRANLASCAGELANRK